VTVTFIDLSLGKNGDNTRVVSTGAVNPDSMGDIGQDNSGASVGRWIRATRTAC